jgi:hypothetical protein
MSEKKYNELIRHSDDPGEEKKEDEENIVREEPEETIVEGVEAYRRPAWHRPLCAAAAFLLIAGGVGTGFSLNRSSKFSQVSEPASYEVTVNLEHPVVASIVAAQRTAAGEETDADKRKEAVETFAKGSDVLHQLVDLALLSNGMLKGKALADFIARSQEVIKAACAK